jgi:hypothetical protein
MMNRRTLIATAALAPLLTLPGCAGGQGFSLVEAIRRLLTLSSQRAFAALMQENGADQCARPAGRCSVERHCCGAAQDQCLSVAPDSASESRGGKGCRFGRPHRH